MLFMAQHTFKMTYLKFMFALLLVIILFTLVNEIFVLQKVDFSRSYISATLNLHRRITKLNANKAIDDKSFEFKKNIFIPGTFLKDKQPGNESFCKFNYNFEDMKKLSDDILTYSPELGESGPYRVIYNVVDGLYKLSNNVTYCTHATPEFLYHLVEIVQRWDGPISLAVYTPDTDAALSLSVLQRMCQCLPGMARVSVHFVFPKNYIPKVSYNLSEADLLHQAEMSDCSAPANLLTGKFMTFRQNLSLTYPVNVARNVARFAANTIYILVSDIELLPSLHLVPAFLSMFERFKKHPGNSAFLHPDNKYVFVLPIFEVERSANVIPETKQKLLELYAQNHAVYFHRWFCISCQKFPGLQRWLQKKPVVGVARPFLIVRREFPYHRWEPVYIGTNKEPLYNEVLSWEGMQDKMAQMMEMCLMGYKFVVLDGAFLVHTPGVKRRSDFPSNHTSWRQPHEQRNIKLYEGIKTLLAKKYGVNKRCKL